MRLTEKFFPNMTADRYKLWFAAEVLALLEIEGGGTEPENIDRIVNNLEQDAKKHPYKPSQWEFVD
jgi:hypothetical protein